jgi:hypothetical protein
LNLNLVLLQTDMDSLNKSAKWSWYVICPKKVDFREG